MEFDRLQLATHGEELQPSAPTHTPLQCSRTTFNHLSWESVFREVVKQLFTRPDVSSSQCRLVIAWSSLTSPTRSTAFIVTPCWMRCLRRVPGIYKFCHLAYSQPSSLTYDGRTIMSQEGSQQGDPLGPVQFCTTIQPLLIVSG